jgi:hypothetical protein
VKVGRGDRIRTCDLYVPNVALYQTELHPDSAILPYFGGAGKGLGMKNIVINTDKALFSGSVARFRKESPKPVATR